MIKNHLKHHLQSGQLGLAMIIKQVQSVDMALAAKTCGYDAIYVDLEHSVISEHSAAQMSLMALHTGITAIVRVPSHDAHYANRILDAGAMGIVAPHVNNADEARQVVKACKFAPLGERSVAGTWPHFSYEAIAPDVVRQTLNDETIVIVMLETPEAVEHADEIAAVPGVDVVHIGSNDLCDAMGIPSQFTHPKIKEAFLKVIAACKKHKKICGAGGLGGAPDVAQKMIQLGVRFITAGNEWGFMMQAAKQRSTQLRALKLDSYKGSS